MNGYSYDPFPVIRTQRLILRAPKPKDVSAFFDLRSNEQTNKYLDRPIAKNIEEAQAHLDKVIKNIEENNWIAWILTLKESDEMMGSVGLWMYDSKSNTADIGFELLPPYWRNGYTSEAAQAIIEFGFRKIKLSKVLAVFHKDNIASRSTLLKLNFRSESEKNEEHIYCLEQNNAIIDIK